MQTNDIYSVVGEKIFEADIFKLEKQQQRNIYLQAIREYVLDKLAFEDNLDIKHLLDIVDRNYRNNGYKSFKKDYMLFVENNNYSDEEVKNELFCSVKWYKRMENQDKATQDLLAELAMMLDENTRDELFHNIYHYLVIAMSNVQEKKIMVCQDLVQGDPYFTYTSSGKIDTFVTNKDISLLSQVVSCFNEFELMFQKKKVLK